MHIFNHSLSIVKQQVLLPISKKLSLQQQRIAILAAAIFSCIAACFLLYLACFKRKAVPVTTTNQASEGLTTTPKIEGVSTPVLKPIADPTGARLEEGKQLPLDVEKLRGAVDQPSKQIDSQKDTQIQTLPVEPSEKSLPKPDPEKESVPDDFQSSERSSEEIDEEDEVGDDEEFPGVEDDVDLDDYFASMDEDDFEEDSDEEIKPKKPLPLAATKKYYLENGKECSLRTFKCIEKIEADLKALDKEHGTAIDNGDCFWDSFAQGLSRLLKREVTIKELREKVSAEVKRLDQGPVEANWVKKMIGKEFAAADTYEDYRDRVAFDCADILEKKLSAPVWGQEARDGVILCRIYQVNLIVYTAGCLDEDLSKMEDKGNFYSGDPKYPRGENYPNTVEMALYPGHFMPVWNISKQVV